MIYNEDEQQMPYQPVITAPLAPRKGSVSVPLSIEVNLDELHEQLARQAAEDIRDDLRKSMRDMIMSEVKPAIVAAINAEVHGLLDKPFRETNAYGEVKGDTTTLREQIAKATRDYWSKTDSWQLDSEANKLIATVVEAQWKTMTGGLIQEVQKQITAKFMDAVKSSIPRA